MSVNICELTFVWSYVASPVRFLLHLALQFVKALNFDNTESVFEKLGAVRHHPVRPTCQLHRMNDNQHRALPRKIHIGEFPLAVNFDRPLDFEVQAEGLQSVTNFSEFRTDFADEVIAVVESPRRNVQGRVENIEFGGEVSEKAPFLVFFSF